MLTFITTAWAGARPIYKPWHIVNVERMLRRHLTIPFRHVCVTDDVDGMRAEGIEAVPLWSVTTNLPPQTKRRYLNNWLRLGLFHEGLMRLVGIMRHDDDVLVSIDADIVIRRNIDHLFSTLHDFKIMSLKERCHLQGGLFMVRPGAVDPNPWRVLHDDAATVEKACRFGGSDQALLSELFYDRTLSGEIPVWNEDDGLAINAQHDCLDWSLFFRTGHRKCWDVRMPEAREYYAQSGRDIETEAREPDILPPIISGRDHSQQGKRRSGAVMGEIRKFRTLYIDRQ